MAKLVANTQTGTGLQIEHEAPPGQYIGVCLKVIDLYGVDRPKFQSQEIVKRDVTRFIFGVLDKSGRPFLIQTFEFTISAAPGSNLFDFLTQWLGAEPQLGWDTQEMVGKGAMLTVAHERSKRNPAKVYSSIKGISPVFAQLAAQVPHPDYFRAVLEAAFASMTAPVGARPGAAPSPAPQGHYPAPQPQAPPQAGQPVYQHPPAAHPAPVPAPQPVYQHAPQPPAPLGHPAPQPVYQQPPAHAPHPGHAPHPVPAPAGYQHPPQAPHGAPQPVYQPQAPAPAPAGYQQPPPAPPVYQGQPPAPVGDDDIPF